MEEKFQDSSKKKENVTADGISQKITNFFPVLRTEGRAKMCGVKTDDSKQKEMLKKMKGKESMTLRSKRLDKVNEKSTNGGTSQTKEKLRNISVSSALKTPLSQVLRKNIEASEKKEAKHNQLKSSEISGNSESQSVKKDSDNERGRTLRQKPPLPEKPRRNSWKRRSESSQLFAANEKTKASSETKSRTTQKISTQSLDTLLEEARSESTGLNSSIAKQKKPVRKRHFRGSTYGLYLTPAKKRKAAKLKYSSDKPKDDDCSVTSTDNNSFLDSEDANSLVSEDFCTPSEKSLVEEDHGSETQASSKPLIPEKKIEKECVSTQEPQEISVTDQTAKKDESEFKMELNADYEENTQNVTDLFQDLEEMQWEADQKTADVLDNANTSKTVKAPQYDDISSESVSNALHFSFKGISSTNREVKTDTTEKCENAIIVDTNNNKDAIPEVNKTENVPSASETCLSIQDSLSDMFNMKDDSNITSSAVSENKPDLNFSTSNQSETKDINFTASNQSETKDLNFTNLNPSETKFNDPDTTCSKDGLKFSHPDAIISKDKLKYKDSDIIVGKDELKFNDPDTTLSKDELTFTVSDITEGKDESKILPCDIAETKLHTTLPSVMPVSKGDSNLTFPECKGHLNLTPTDLTDDKEMDLVSAVLSANEDAPNKISPEDLGENEDTPSQMESDDIEDSNMMETIQENREDGTNFESSMKIDNSGKQGDITEFSNLEDDTDDNASTIATCVKSRQRIKRRFTDDIVDTDLGMLSVAAMASVKKALLKPEPPKDAVERFQPATTQNEVKRGSTMAKIECVYNYKQTAIKKCSCEGDSYQAKLDKSEEGAFCQAVDSIDDKLLGCSNPVVTSRLVRPSVKIPFTIMCEVHLWRLKHHQACPYCGLFCSQGPFMQCKTDEGKVLHYYHEQCQTKEDCQEQFCLHCGSHEKIKRVHLEMHMTTPPSFFLSQTSNISVPDVSKARISFSEYSDFCKKEEEEPNQMFKIEDSDKILSSAGLPNGTHKEELEKLISALNEEKVRACNLTAEDFYEMATAGNILKVLYMLAKGFDPNTKFINHDNETAMHAASAAGHITVVHLLIQAGAVNDSLNEKMYTPLMLAVENGHKDVVHYLVKKGALTDFKGENGMSSLHLAAKGGNLEVLKMLMSSRDTDINSQDDGGWTPIVWASEHDHLNVVRYLLKRGANPNLRDNEGNIGLHWSAFSGSVEISYLYLDYGCDINAVNELGDTPLHIAARQDSFPCVTLFLSRGADVQVLNKANKLPAECCIDKNSDTYLSLSLNMLVKRITTKYQHKAEKILHRDISRGKEQLAIQCVNAWDDEMPPLDFLYVTENCETMPIKIDRTITSLQSCHCEDDCSTNSCSCASISYQCWYDKEGLLLPEFNLLDPPMLFECNRACSCWSLNCHNRVLQNGITSRLQLIRTKGKGWGVRTLKDIPKGAFICEYVGELISDSAADKRSDDSYLFDLDNRDGETYCLDARYYGNISRFINHLCEPNLVPVKVYVDHQDLNFPRIAFFSSRDIKQYEELGFDYGEKFWAIKYKFFTCECGTTKCKYSKESIHSTLANYYRRLKEEQMEEAAALQQQPVMIGQVE